MNAKELFEAVKPIWEKFDPSVLEEYMIGLNEGSRKDVLDKSQSGYYQFLPCLVQYLKPRQIVELGGAMGASALMMLSSLPSKSTIYSITLPENGLEFSFVKKDYTQLVKCVGDDIDLTNWPKSLDLSQTDLWFFDSEHTYKQLTRELKKYQKFFKKGTVILVDDIHLNEGMFRAWLKFPGDKTDLTAWLHWSGFGLIVI